MSAFILPFFPAMGEIGLVVTLVALWKHQYRCIISIPFNRGFLLLGLWLIVLSCFAFQPQEAFLGLANFVPFIALITAFTILIQNPSQLRQLAWLLVLPSFPIVILGLGQLFGHWSSPPIIEQVLGWRLVDRGEPEGRMSSIFMYANILAAYLVIVFALAIGLWIDTYQEWRQNLKHNKPFAQIAKFGEKQRNGKGKRSHSSLTLYPLPFDAPPASLIARGACASVPLYPKKIWILGFLSLIIIIDGIGLILTKSRNAWGLAFLACLVFAFYLGWRWIVLSAVTAASTILYASWGPSPGREWLRQIVPTYFWARLSDEMYPDRPLATLRTTQWQFAWDMTVQRPWTGWGLRNFTPLYKAKWDLWLGHPHNFFLMLLAEIGIPGTLLLCGLVGWTIFLAIKKIEIWSKSQKRKSRDRLILFTYLLAFGNCILFNVFDVTVFDLRVNTLSWLLLAAIAGSVNSSISRDIRENASTE
ncbi:MAG: O-antigen ligase family protein [Hydrococcus sp. Prado102]|nr:O-antigen ligase family protein [Hydrococcus sp. Prado102]